MLNRKKYWIVNLIAGFFILFFLSKIDSFIPRVLFSVFIDMPLGIIGEIFGHNKVSFHIMQGIIYAGIGSIFIHILREVYRLIFRPIISLK